MARYRIRAHGEQRTGRTRKGHVGRSFGQWADLSMAAPVVVVAARVAVLWRDDLRIWGLLALAVALSLLLLPILLPILGFGAILALFSGLSGVPQGGGPVPGGSPSTLAVGQLPADQLALMQQVSSSAPCSLPSTVFAVIAEVESTFGATADQTSPGRACMAKSDLVAGSWAWGDEPAVDQAAFELGGAVIASVRADDSMP
jgi:hypothetical protein